MAFSFWWVGLHVQAWTTVASLAFHPELTMDARLASAFRPGKDSADGAINILRAGHARLACEVSGAVMPPAAGTHRSDSLAALRRP